MFIIKPRRRREKKTNYKKRLALVKSEKTRLVIRRSLNNMRVQFVNFKETGDVTLVSAFSKELKKHGWSSSTGNLPASYLTGFLAGSRAKKAGINEAVLDMGTQTSTKGSRIYSALKGVIDSGIKIPHSAEILPKEDRIKGVHISKDISKSFDETKNKISAAVK